MSILRSVISNNLVIPSFIAAFNGLNLEQTRGLKRVGGMTVKMVDTSKFTKKRWLLKSRALHMKYPKKTPRQREHVTNRLHACSRAYFGARHRAILKGQIPPSEAAGMAWNHEPRKKHLMKPEHTVEEQIEYMNSRAYFKAYQGMEVWRFFKRSQKGQEVRYWHTPRLRCLDKYGIFNMNHACPICRDEYLFFDYRNPALMKQFLFPSTMSPLPILKVFLCIEQYVNLEVQLLKAREHCTIDWGCDTRFYDYKELYGDKWQPEERDLELHKLHWADNKDRRHLSRGYSRVEMVHDAPLIAFEPHNRDMYNWWDLYWHRHQKFSHGVNHDPNNSWEPKDDGGVN